MIVVILSVLRVAGRKRWPGWKEPQVPTEVEHDLLQPPTQRAATNQLRDVWGRWQEKAEKRGRWGR